jgi:hypothetical protein
VPAFITYDKAKVKKAIPKEIETAEEAVDFYNGDHWRGGLGWVGPTPKPGNPELVFIMAEIAKQFVSRNIIKVVVDRHVSALLAAEPSWMFVPKRILKSDEEPNAEEQAQAQKAEQLVADWWDKTRALDHLKQAVTDALLKKRGALRVFVPPAKVQTVQNEDGTTSEVIQTLPLEEGIMKLLFVEKSGAVVIQDEDTMEKASVLIKKDNSGKEIVEFSFVQEDGTTIVRTWGKNATPTDISLPLGGRLIVKEIEREPLVTRQMLSAQKSLNMALTMLDRNAIQGGFLERVILNAEPPGEWVNDPNSPDGRKFVPKPMQIGAGRTTFIGSRVVESNESGDPPIVLPADIRWKDPIKPDTFIATAAEHRYGIYEEASQLHALISGDATASAVSRVQARADFLDSLSKTKPQVDEAVRWLMEIALDHACFFAGIDRETEFGLIRAACNVQISTGPLTPEERAAVMDMVEKEMLSLETAMQLLGVEDVDAELSRLAQEAANPNPSRKLKMMDTYAKAGYTFAPDQLGAIDKELGVKERDMVIVLADQQASQDMQRERLRQQRNASDLREY